MNSLGSQSIPSCKKTQKANTSDFLSLKYTCAWDLGEYGGIRKATKQYYDKVSE